MEFEPKLMKHIDLLIERYPALADIKDALIDAYLLMEECYLNGGKLLIAGNGGSASDSEHIAGELMKSFKSERRISDDLKEKLIAIDSVRGEQLAKNLQQPLTAIPLVAHEALSTAYINDVDGYGVFAQQLLGFGREGDVFLAISTSGNSKNVMNATVVARALGIRIIGLTGQTGAPSLTLSDAPCRWNIQYSGAGRFILSPSDMPGMRIDLSNAGDFEGNTVKLWRDTGYFDAQSWKLASDSNGNYQIQTVFGSGRTIMVPKEGDALLLSGRGRGVRKWIIKPAEG